LPKSAGEKCLVVVRIRGTINVRGDVKDTLAMLRLHKPNHATLIPATPTYLGMLQKAKDYIAWGEASKETIAKLLRFKGRLIGGKRLTEENLKKLGFKGFNHLAEALYSGKIRLKDISELKPVFRLHPPSGGFKRPVKKAFSEGGELGYRGEEINGLIEKMV
jgi:large subunit ribosomal protein L30